MTYEEFKKVKVGDVVSLQLGKNKGEKCIVESIWDFEETGNRRIYIWK